MPDASGAALAPKAKLLADYQVPAFAVDTIDLIFALDEAATRVQSRLVVRRNPKSSDRTAPLHLDGEALDLVSVSVDGVALTADAYTHGTESLTIHGLADQAVIEIETRISPAANTSLSGLYVSAGTFCTQCEAEGFRRITYFPDRPDVMTRFTTTLVADAARYPVLLSNGNPIDRGTAENGQHWVKWEDPHPKPAYLFALVAGNLTPLKDEFTTKSGRTVSLAIWVRPEDADKCGHAMASLKTAMAWDEAVFGLEYDLDIFNIVAVSDFNFGAMENKGLNIFNTAYILAKPETATDADYFGIESVVAHEYFHNWTGNRVTCRDWFQLSLKEGLTVFRDQQFSADQGSSAVCRINDVRRLRAGQFPEDGGPLAHPVRPESYIEIDNFYTATVYQKGAELVRMIHRLIGAAAFRRGIDLYFTRHDNHAVTIEDFVAAMQDASGIDLGSFKRWYSQAGTPDLAVSDHYDAATKTYDLTFVQQTKPTPGQPDKHPLVMPIAMGLIGADGVEIATRLAGEAEPATGTRVLQVTAAEQSFRFVDVPTHPVPSVLRGFSAPVKLAPLPLASLKFLALHDTDPFARWEAGQQVATRILLDLVAAHQRGDTFGTLDTDLIAALRRVLETADHDPAFAAESLALPGEAYLADQMSVVDVVAIHAARRFARQAIAHSLHDLLSATYHRLQDHGPYRLDAAAVGKRALKNTCLAYLNATGSDAAIALAVAQVKNANNMTDTLSALGCMNDQMHPDRDRALAQFHETWRHEDLVINKWFSLQAMSARPDTADRVKALLAHPSFTLKNPNRARALIMSFASANPLHFHAIDGSGYRFLADQVIALDPINPMVAARMVQPLGTWRRHDGTRQALMRAELERVLAVPGLSKGAFEMASKSLNA